MIETFHYYLENGFVRKASPDKGEAEALMNKAEGRLKFSIKTREITENTASIFLKTFTNA
ncbi:MAG: hypothetical protein QXO56_03400 [Candidatus Pacearchaeota archaeon]